MALLFVASLVEAAMSTLARLLLLEKFDLKKLNVPEVGRILFFFC